MKILAFIAQFGGWAWIIGGLLLFALELLVPGGVLVWLGGAAVLTGIATLLGIEHIAMQWALFGGFSLAGILSWIRMSRNGAVEISDSPLLNQRAARLVGLQTVLITPIENGFGRIDVADSSWRVSGTDLPVGTEVRVIGFQGAILMVEAVH